MSIGFIEKELERDFKKMAFWARFANDDFEIMPENYTEADMWKMLVEEDENEFDWQPTPIFLEYLENLK